MMKSKESCCEGESEGLRLSEDEKLTSFCKALSHPIRLTILRTLIEKGLCISGDRSEILPVAASTVSEHLRILKDSGLVQGTINGPRRNYCVNSNALSTLKILIQNL